MKKKYESEDEKKFIQGFAYKPPKTDYHDFTYFEMPTEERRAMNVGDIYDNKIQCTKCQYIIRSKNRHHYITCKCGAVSVDGGSWYQKIAYTKKSDFISRIKYFKYRSNI